MAAAEFKDQICGKESINAEPDGSAELPFWKTKTLAQMDGAEWESLCDGCGRCCLVKLEDEDTGTIHFTDVACRLLDTESCRCRDYPNRQAFVHDCIRLTVEEVERLSWLPPTCAYRLVREGADLYWWHPLVSGDPHTVHMAGVSLRGRSVTSEEDLDEEDFPDRIVTWPNKVPRSARRRTPT
ncbi:MAG: YcgN family cysteine cluster protein [Chelatococcus sp.]|jgi:uncharacterized cysteine cluster protein YcgN (CxxCxxCC family)|uniref:YcgN family cysteine cluster protein n=1 Tax=Chelatococcus sp. TaxID=1953771 RepID=UPI0025C022CC|nr:YcgN family cysteine cluster protein [Chelatococcus sp.]MBX3537373.1 YcgN family cysteine cluster protein [Chelatococcus sp.]